MVNGEALEAVLMFLVVKINETTTGVVAGVVGVDRQPPPLPPTPACFPPCLLERGVLAMTPFQQQEHRQ
jgi:hypothetical protein